MRLGNPAHLVRQVCVSTFARCFPFKFRKALAPRQVLSVSPSSSNQQIRCLVVWVALVTRVPVPLVRVFVSVFLFSILISLGAFGATNNQANNSTASAFGAPKPATGFGAFGGGGTSAFGSGGGTSAFGNAGQATTSAFGQPANNNTSAFGNTGGSSIFGQPKTTSAFGTAAASKHVHLIFCVIL